MVTWVCAINCNLANRCLLVSLYSHRTKAFYFHLDKRVMLSSRKKLKKAQRGSPLWHGKLNHCLLTWTWSLFCSDRSRVVRGKWLTLLFPHLVLLVRCQTSMSWTHHFFLRLPWLTQHKWQPCLLYQTHRTQGSLPRKLFAHTLQV